MTKKLLNKEKREYILAGLTRAMIEASFPKTRAEIEEARTAMRVAFMKEHAAQLPVGDLDVLRRHNLTLMTRSPVVLDVRSRNRFSAHIEKSVEMLQVGHSQVAIIDQAEEIVPAYDTFKDAEKRLETLRATLRKSYAEFVMKAKTFEDIVAVLPECAAFEDKLFATTAVAVISPDVVAIVKADAEARAAVKGQ